MPKKHYPLRIGGMRPPMPKNCNPPAVISEYFNDHYPRPQIHPPVRPGQTPARLRPAVTVQEITMSQTINQFNHQLSMINYLHTRILMRNRDLLVEAKIMTERTPVTNPIKRG